MVISQQKSHEVCRRIRKCARKVRWAAKDSAGVYKIDMVRMCAERTDEYSNVRVNISACRNAGAATQRQSGMGSDVHSDNPRSAKYDRSFE